LGESERLALIREIENKRGSRLITYITIDRPGLSQPIDLDDLRVIERHLRLCLGTKAKKIDLFLYTPGGYAIVPWALVSLYREFLGARPFSVLVPSRAFSAGTMISLGADEIIMSPSGNLGPIDFQLSGEDGRIGVESVRAYFKLAQDMGLSSQRDKLQVFAMLAATTHPINIGQIYRAWAENERLAMLLLGSRRRPLSEKANKEIADFLLRGVGDHSQTVRRTEARQMGISFIHDSEEMGIEAAMNGLFDAYEELLALDVPFVRSDTYTINDEGEAEPVREIGPVALVESLDRLDVGYLKEGWRFWRSDVPADAPARQPAPQPAFEAEAQARFSVRWQPLRNTNVGRLR